MRKIHQFEQKSNDEFDKFFMKPSKAKEKVYAIKIRFIKIFI
jgi:hypothetical protein